MEITIRQETNADYEAVFNVVEQAFLHEEVRDGTEQFLVVKLRKSAAFIPELSIVAEYQDQIIGHVLLTKLKIISENGGCDSLGLAPIAVHPDYQKKGIGTKLIHAAHEKAKTLGYQSVLLIGHENYYPKFGYVLASQFGIKFPFTAPDPNCQAIELIPGALTNCSGLVEYPQEFFT